MTRPRFTRFTSHELQLMASGLELQDRDLAKATQHRSIMNARKVVSDLLRSIFLEQRARADEDQG